MRNQAWAEFAILSVLFYDGRCGSDKDAKISRRYPLVELPYAVSHGGWLAFGFSGLR